MALGQQLTTPETGWKRVDDKDSNINYYSPSGSGWSQFDTGSLNWLGSAHYSYTAGNTIKFNFTGKNIRIIAYMGSDSANNIPIILDGISNVFSEHTTLNNQTTCVVYESLTLQGNEHSVIITTPSGTARFEFDAVDIDVDASVIPYNILAPGELKTSTLQTNIGDYISCEYMATSGVFGSFANLGKSTKGIIPISQIEAPNGSFYFIMVGYDTAGNKKFIADRNIQYGIPWDSLNVAGLCSSNGNFITIDGDSTHYIMRLMSGGVSATDTNNEWDKIICNGLVHPGDNICWNWNIAYSWTSTTAPDGNTYRVCRGDTAANGYGSMPSSAANDYLGFRPVLIANQGKIIPPFLLKAIDGKCYGKMNA